MVEVYIHTNTDLSIMSENKQSIKSTFVSSLAFVEVFGFEVFIVVLGHLVLVVVLG